MHAKRVKDEGRGQPWPADKSREREWHNRARDYGTLHDGWFEVVPGTAEHRAWALYFDAGGWRPVTFPRGVGRGGGVIPSPAGTRSWTAPCRWPVDLGF